MGPQDATDLKERLFIDGTWRVPVEGGTLPVIDPATEEVFHQVPEATSADVDIAVEAAQRAFADWAGTDGAARAEILRRMADWMERSLNRLTAIEVRDNGKPVAEAKWDIEDAAGCFRYYAGLAEGLTGTVQPIALPTEDFVSEVRRVPVGVAGQITPWNYPMLMAAWKIAPALAAGCTSVLKPSELTPLTALEYGTASLEAGLPPGVLNILTGTGVQAGAPLAAHPGLAKLAFTGSVPTGRAVMHAAAEGIKAVSLELGGKSPVLVFDDADVEQAVEWIMFGIFWNQGEVCSATSRLLVQQGIAPRLLDRLAQEAARIPIGSGFDTSTLLGPLISEGQRDKVRGFIDRAVGTRVTPESTVPSTGWFVPPTIFVDVPETAELWTDEVFGPVLAVRTFRDEADALRQANAAKMGLAAAIMTADPGRASRVADALEAGIVWINCSQPTFTQAPWGGVKHSGIGRELGEWGLANYLEVKQVTTYVSPKPWGWYLKP